MILIKYINIMRSFHLLCCILFFISGRNGFTMNTNDSILSVITFDNDKFFELNKNDMEKLSWDKLPDFDGIVINSPDCRWALQNRPLMGTSKPATFQVKYIVLHLLFRFIVQPITFPFNCKHVSIFKESVQNRCSGSSIT